MPGVTFKGVILVTEGLMALINNRPDYDPAANKPLPKRSPLLPVFTEGCAFDSLIRRNYC